MTLEGDEDPLTLSRLDCRYYSLPKVVLCLKHLRYLKKKFLSLSNDTNVLSKLFRGKSFRSPLCPRKRRSRFTQLIMFVVLDSALTDAVRSGKVKAMTHMLVKFLAADG